MRRAILLLVFVSTTPLPVSGQLRDVRGMAPARFALPATAESGEFARLGLREGATAGAAQDTVPRINSTPTRHLVTAELGGAAIGFLGGAYLGLAVDGYLCRKAEEESDAAPGWCGGAPMSALGMTVGVTVLPALLVHTQNHRDGLFPAVVLASAASLGAGLLTAEMMNMKAFYVLLPVEQLVAVIATERWTARMRHRQ